MTDWSFGAELEYFVTKLSALLIVFQALDVLEDKQLEPVGCETIEVIKDLVDDLQQQPTDPAAKELNNILCNPHFKV